METEEKLSFLLSVLSVLSLSFRSLKQEKEPARTILLDRLLRNYTITSSFQC